MTKITYNDGMKIYWDHPIEMEDGVILRADIFCPEAAGKYPVIMTYGVYGKWLDFRELRNCLTLITKPSNEKLLVYLPAVGDQ